MLYDLSYANLTLLGASLPSYKNKSKGNGESSEETINGDDPDKQDAIDKLFDESKRR